MGYLLSCIISNTNTGMATNLAEKVFLKGENHCSCVGGPTNKPACSSSAGFVKTADVTLHDLIRMKTKYVSRHELLHIIFQK